MFTAHQTLASAQDFFRDIKSRAVGLGRQSEPIKVLPILRRRLAS